MKVALIERNPWHAHAHTARSVAGWSVNVVNVDNVSSSLKSTIQRLNLVRRRNQEELLPLNNPKVPILLCIWKTLDVTLVLISFSTFHHSLSLVVFNVKFLRVCVAFHNSFLGVAFQIPPCLHIHISSSAFPPQGRCLPSSGYSKYAWNLSSQLCWRLCLPITDVHRFSYVSFIFHRTSAK